MPSFAARVPWPRAALAVLAATLLGVPAAGFAAGLGGVGADGLEAGSATVAPCDPDGFALTYAVSAGKVTSATVGGIADPACEGGTLKLTLADGGAAISSGGPTTVPTDAGTVANSVTVALSPAVDALLVDHVHVSIAGP